MIQSLTRIFQFILIVLLNCQNFTSCIKIYCELSTNFFTTPNLYDLYAKDIFVYDFENHNKFDEAPGYG